MEKIPFRIVTRAYAFTTLTLLLACSSEPPAPTVPKVATAIAKHAGDAQSATVGTNVAIPPTVLVTDQNGAPMAGVTVTFSVFDGGGSVTGETQTTTSAGLATVATWTVGTTAGANTLTATAATFTATFTATATPGAVASFSVLHASGATLGDQTVGVQIPLRLVALDTYGNMATSFTGTVAVSSNRTGSQGLGTSSAFSNGNQLHAVTLTQAGAGATITATHTGGTATGTSAVFTVNP